MGSGRCKNADPVLFIPARRKDMIYRTGAFRTIQVMGLYFSLSMCKNKIQDQLADITFEV